MGNTFDIVLIVSEEYLEENYSRRKIQKRT